MTATGRPPSLPPPLRDRTLIRDYREAKEVLNDDVRFLQASKVESAPFVGDTVLTLTGDGHVARRRLLSRLMRRSTLGSFEREVLDPTVDRAVAEAVALGRADLVRLSRSVFLQLSAATIGLQRITTQRDADRLAGYLHPLIEAVTVEWSTRPHDDVMRDGLRAKSAYLRDLLEPALASRERDVQRCLAGEIDASELPTDLLTLMSLHVEDAEARTREAVLFLVASTINNAATMTHLVDEMCRWVAEEPGRRGHLADDALLARAVAETLRYHVVTPAVFRHAQRETSLTTGRRVAAGEELAILLPEVNRDPGVWGEDAAVFDPLREVPSGERPYGLAFGAGQHVCLGRPLVLGSYSDSLGAGTLVRFARRLFDAGVTPDPDCPATRAPSAQSRFDTYPVVLRGVTP